MRMEKRGLKRIHPILDAFVEELKPIYGKALKKVILFGSYARGEEHDGSDVDILLLLDMTDANIERCDDALCELVYEHEVHDHITISPITMSFADYSRWKNVHEFLLNVCEDGVSLYGEAA